MHAGSTAALNNNSNNNDKNINNNSKKKKTTKKQEEYIAAQLQSGDYQNASELVRDALRLHQIYRNRIIDELRMEIEKGWNSPVSNLSAADIVAQKLKGRTS